MAEGRAGPPLEARPEASVPVRDPWIETREGSLFFVNALLAGPGMLVLLPLGLRALLDVLGLSRGFSPVLDPIPGVAAHFLPWVGWLALLPMATTAWNLGMERRRAPRAALVFFLFLHAGFLGYTVWRWVG